MNKYSKIKEKLNIVLRKGIFSLIFILFCASSVALNANAVNKNTWIKKSGKTHYFNKKGRKVKGLKKIKGNYYYFNKKGVLFKKGWKTVKGNKYYIKKGKVQTGWKTVGNKTYYFNTKGVMQTGKWINKNYYVNAKGILQKDCWIRFSGGSYYVDMNGKKLMNRWKTIGDYKYYFNAKGKNTKKIKITSPDVDSNNAIENTVKNRMIQRSNIDGVINHINDVIRNMGGADAFEATGYNQVMTIITKAKSMRDNYNNYTATELYNFYNQIKNCASMLKVIQVLTYYPDQSRAIFRAINEYRKSLGITELKWSDALSKTSRLEAGYRVYVYVNSLSTNNPLPEVFFRNHRENQNGYVKAGGYLGLNETITGWKSSSLHDPLLRSSDNYYGAAAYYTYNTEDGGMYTKIIFTAWPRDEEASTNAALEDYDTILNSATSIQTFE